MYKATTTVRNKTGLHMRPATEFIACAGKFQSDIKIGRADTSERSNAKSIVMLLKLALGKDTQVEIIAEGTDEQEAVNTLVALIDGGFGDL